DNDFVLNPTHEQMPNSKLDLVVAGTADAVLMVESEAKELSEDTMLGAVMFGHREMQKVIDAIIRLAEKAAKEPREIKLDDYSKEESSLTRIVEDDLRSAYQVAHKGERHDRIDAIRATAAAELVGEDEGKIKPNTFGKLFKEIESRVMRGAVLDTGRRIDG